MPIDTDNPQCYESSPLSRSVVAEEYGSAEHRLFNDRKPNLAILHEKPEHRTMVFLKVEGLSNSEIARITGYTDSWVSQILRQPWARKMVVDELSRAGRNAAEELIQSAVVDSILKVIDIRDTADKKETQLAASKELLDRGLGKAVQRVETRSLNLNLSGDLEQTDAELARLEREEQELMKRIS